MRLSGTSAESVRTELEKILSSDGFARNDRLSKFLRFVVEQHLGGNDAELKESLIGIEVFGRKPGYDPRQDSIVRTEAAKLRTRLVRYYSGEGSDDAIVIEVPKGGYNPPFRKLPVRESQLVRGGALRSLSRSSLLFWSRFWAAGGAMAIAAR
jgi:hypothetical protein